MPIGAVVDPNFEDFTNPVEEPTAKTHHLSGAIHQVRKASHTAYFSGKLNWASNKRIRGPEMGNSFMSACCSTATNRKTQGERRWLWRGIIIGRFVNKYALVRCRGAYLEVDLDDMRSAIRLLAVLGCNSAFRLHLPSTKFPIHYSVGSHTLISLSEMRNGIPNRNQTTWTNTDTMASHRAFYEPTRNQKIAIRELGGVEALNYFTGLLGSMEDLKHEEWAKDYITELKSLIR